VNYELNGLNIGRAHVFQRSTGDHLSDIKASVLTDGARFGASVDIADSKIIIGAPGGFNSNSLQSGVAYIFDIQGVYKNTIEPSDGADGDFFGHCVSIDSGNIIVGAPKTGANAGHAYVFTYTGTFVDKIGDENAQNNAYFGWSVVINGNVWLIGAYLYDNVATDDGAAFLYVDGIFSTILSSPAPVDNLQFGSSVTRNGQTGNVIRAGSTVYAFGKNGNSEFELEFPGAAAPSDAFGRTISSFGANLLVGADGDGNVAGSGVAYLFNQVANTSTLIAADNGQANDKFGFSVAIDTDTIIVGSHEADLDGLDQGVVYIYVIP